MSPNPGFTNTSTFRRRRSLRSSTSVPRPPPPPTCSATRMRALMQSFVAWRFEVCARSMRSALPSPGSFPHASVGVVGGASKDLFRSSCRSTRGCRQTDATVGASASLLHPLLNRQTLCRRRAGEASAHGIQVPAGRGTKLTAGCVSDAAPIHQSLSSDVRITMGAAFRGVQSGQRWESRGRCDCASWG